MAGTFGYELDPAKLSEEEKTQIRGQIEEFKKYYDVIHFGDYYRLTNAMEEGPYAAWEFVSEDGNEALVSVVASRVRANDPGVRIRLRGLKENQMYLVNGVEYPGGFCIGKMQSCRRNFLYPPGTFMYNGKRL